MRRVLSIGAVLLSVVVAAGCASAGSTDPYQLAFKARSATWEQVQVDLSLSAHLGTRDVKLDPGAIRIVLDTKANKGLLHLAIPTSTLGPEAAMLPRLGVTGDTLGLDVLFDGSALYARSPLAPALLAQLLAGSGDLPNGDLTGWLLLASPTELASLAALGQGAMASASPEATFADAAALKASLTSKGVTLAYVATESRDGITADHLSATVDWDKLAATATTMRGMSAVQANAAIAQLKDMQPTIGIWIDHASGRLVGVEVKGTSTKDATQTFDVSVSLKTPDSGISLETPSSAVAVPLLKNLLPMLQRMTGGTP